MAEALFEDFLTCPVCLDPLKEPVTLGCHHTFCRSCLNNSWLKNPANLCPVCRRRSSKEIVEVNFALRELSLSFSEQKKVKQPKVCSSHPEIPPLFCLEEARALCPVCEFSLHSQHTVVSGEEAERRLKAQVQKQLQALKEQKKSYEELETRYDRMQRHAEEQVQFCKGQITDLFARLQRFLKEEEERALNTLRVEQNRQRLTLVLELNKVRKQNNTVSNSIQEFQQCIQAQTFLTTPIKTLSKASSIVPSSHPQPKAGLLINTAKVLGNLSFRVWRNMKSLVTYSPVILDPNTAADCMHLSQDLCGVRHGPPQALSEVPERFTNEPMVLGSEGFTSGTHEWDVEVGDLPTWDIGVVKESIDKRGDIFADASYGIWCLWHGDGRYDKGNGKTIPMKTAPKKIRVKVEYEKGRVSFYDADRQQLTLLLAHSAVFTEKLFPYVSVGPAHGAKTQELRLCGQVPHMDFLWTRGCTTQ